MIIYQKVVNTQNSHTKLKRQEKFTVDNGLMEKDMDKEKISGPMAQFMKATG